MIGLLACIFSRFTLVSIHHIISFQLFYKYSLSLSFSLVSFSSFVLCCLFVRTSHPSDDFLLLYVCTLVLLMLWNPSPFLRTKLFDTVWPTMGSVRSTWLSLQLFFSCSVISVVCFLCPTDWWPQNVNYVHALFAHAKAPQGTNNHSQREKHQHKPLVEIYLTCWVSSE